MCLNTCNDILIIHTTNNRLLVYRQRLANLYAYLNKTKPEMAATDDCLSRMGNRKMDASSRIQTTTSSY